MLIVDAWLREGRAAVFATGARDTLRYHDEYHD